MVRMCDRSAYDAGLLRLISYLCGRDIADPEVIDRMYPPAVLAKTDYVGCAVLHLDDGTTVTGTQPD